MKPLQALLCLCLLTLCAGCGGEEPSGGTVAHYYTYPVRVELSLVGEAHTLLTPFSAYVVAEPRTVGEYTGVGGIVVVHGYELGGGGGHFFAFDLACPHHLPAVVPVQVHTNATPIFAQCPECGTKYDLLLGTGHPTTPPSKHPLQLYPVRQPSAHQLLVHW